MKAHPQVKPLSSRFIPIVIILIVSMAIYLNILPNGFVHDDNDQVLENIWIKDITHIPDIFFSSVWSFLEEKVVSNYYRPMMHIIYMVDYHLFGLNPWGFHLTSILFHTLNGIMVFLIASMLLNSKSSFIHHSPFTIHYSPALISALLFAIHPINTESVAWVAGIPELSFTFFYLLSLYLYINVGATQRVAPTPGQTHRSAPTVYLYTFSLLSYALSLLSKEPALTLPILLFVYDRFVKREPLTPLSPWIKRYLPYALVGVFYIALRINALKGFAPRVPAHEYLSSPQYFLNIFPLILKYFERLLFPINLNFFHTFRPVYSPFELKAIVSIGFTVLMVLVLWRMWKVDRLSFFTILWIFIPLLPVFYIPGLGRNTFAERYLYLPSVGFAILLTIGIKKAFEVFGARGKYSKTLSAFFIIFTSLTIVFYSATTFKRNFIFKNDYTLWTDTVKKSPDNGFVQLNLGIAHAKKGEDDKAIEAYQRALKATYLPADLTLTHYNLGNAYNRKGMLDEAITEYKKTIEIDPYYYKAINNLGAVYARKGLIDEAVVKFREALDIKPDFEDAKRNLERALKLKR